MNRRPAVFFDRDDTLIQDIPYLGDPAGVVLMPECGEALNTLREHGFRLFIVSNQSGVGRGLITLGQVDAVNAEIRRQLKGVAIDGIYCCYDDPRNPREHRRKPSPAMLFEARDEHGLDLRRSYVVGDKLRDVQAGQNARCKAVYYCRARHTADDAKARTLADYASESLANIAAWICRDAAAAASTD